MNKTQVKELVHKKIGKFGCHYEIKEADDSQYKPYYNYIVAIENIEGEWETIVDAVEIVEELCNRMGGKRVRFAEEKVELLNHMGLDEGEDDDEELGAVEYTYEFVKIRM